MRYLSRTLCMLLLDRSYASSVRGNGLGKVLALEVGLARGVAMCTLQGGTIRTFPEYMCLDPLGNGDRQGYSGLGRD